LTVKVWSEAANVYIKNNEKLQLGHFTCFKRKETAVRRQLEQLDQDDRSSDPIAF